MALGKLKTPAPTIAVTLWNAEYHHFASREPVTGSHSSTDFPPYFFPSISSAAPYIYVHTTKQRITHKAENQHLLEKKIKKITGTNTPTSDLSMKRRQELTQRRAKAQFKSTHERSILSANYILITTDLLN